MHFASIKSSKRLQRTLAVLQDHEEHSTRDLMWNADICAVSTVVGELRLNGYCISCRVQSTPRGPIWLYQLIGGVAA